MYKKIIAMCLCLGLMLTGCQLAQPEETQTTQDDTQMTQGLRGRHPLCFSRCGRTAVGFLLDF